MRDRMVRPEELDTPKVVSSDALVDAWFAETFHNIELPTHLHNRFYAAAQELKKRLAAKKE